MKAFLILAGSVLLVVALAGCSPGINEGIGHRITFDSTGMKVHATGKPDAHVGRDGSLDIGGRAIDVTPAQRELLQRYYGEARATMATGKAVGRQGVQMATHGIGAAIRSIFHDDSTEMDKRMDAASANIEAAAGKLCHDVEALAATQEAIASGIPAFAPYASGNRVHCRITRTVATRADAKGHATATATTTTTLTDDPE